MPGRNLTRAEARERASHINVGSYDITLDLTGKGPTFRSQTIIQFNASDSTSTFVDLIAEKIHSIKLNGVEIPVDIYKDSRIELQNLANFNELVVDAECKYMNTGEGIHRFIDPVDNQTYLYTQFEVADSRRVFAVFEQPNLKSTFTFHISAPSDWRVLSNSPTPEPSPVLPNVENPHNASTWHFTPTEQISSYLTAIVAGPYKGGTSSLVSTDGRTIELGVYSRASMEKYLDVEEIIDVTVKGFHFYESEFSCAYPFRKYDQIFVPEFNAGAMENPGCVTIAEDYIFRSRPDGAAVESRANTILHELAHMWFGDLVTMHWWNDLWLNESFAEFMSHLCAADATQWTQAWESFLCSRKAWGSRQDQLPSTHPIVSTVSDLNDVWANFDGITYAKGASVLKQLMAFVGRGRFMQGLSNYFTKHAWGNTVLGDLITDIQTAANVDLHNWAKVWLEEPGINLLRPEITLTPDGQIEKLTVFQEKGNAPSLRPHCLGVGLYQLHNGRLEQTYYEEIALNGESKEVTNVVGLPAPDLVIVNDGDLTYTKIRLDEKSWQTALAHCDRFTDTLARQLVLGAAWDMCRDGEVPASEYVSLALRAVSTEENPSALRMLLANIATATNLYSAPEYREDLKARVCDQLLKIADEAKAGSELQFQTTLVACGLLTTPEQIARATAWLDEKEIPSGFKIDTDGRWRLLAGIAEVSAVDEAKIAQELAHDNTSNGIERATLAKAALPNPSAKEQVFKEVLEQGSLPNAQAHMAIAGFKRGNPEILVPFFTRILDIMPSVWENQTYEMAAKATGIYPISLVGRSDIDVIALTQAWVAEHPDLPAAILRFTNEYLDDAKRTLHNQNVDRMAKR